MAETVSKTPGLLIESNTIVGTTYAQMVGIIVTDIDITFEFVYANPRPPVEKGHVVARITLPRAAGEGIAKAITDVIAEHEAKKGGKKNES